ncbi:MAG: hypothetical protein ACRDD4_11085 [Culicoidibacterales bacterium]
MENRTKKHVVMFSGGASSAYVAKWVADKYGKENTVLFFTDTLWEDSDNYRFLDDVADYLGLEITRRVDGRTPEDVFFDMKYLGNSRLAKCSEELKVRQTIIFIEELRDENFEPVLYFGIGPHEQHRAKNLSDFYGHVPLEPVETKFPMIDILKEDMNVKHIIANEWGIPLPRMYALGFSHANCMGRCVRGGYHHYANLYRVWPEVYAEQEEMEENFRKQFNKDVSIMKKNGGPYTMKQYRTEVLELMSACELAAYSQGEDDTVPCVCSFS